MVEDMRAQADLAEAELTEEYLDPQWFAAAYELAMRGSAEGLRPPTEEMAVASPCHPRRLRRPSCFHCQLLATHNG